MELLLGLGAAACLLVAIAPVLTAGAQCIAAFMMGRGIGQALGALAATSTALVGTALLLAPSARQNQGSVLVFHALALAAAPWLASWAYGQFLKQKKA